MSYKQDEDKREFKALLAGISPDSIAKLYVAVDYITASIQEKSGDTRETTKLDAWCEALLSEGSERIGFNAFRKMVDGVG